MLTKPIVALFSCVCALLFPFFRQACDFEVYHVITKKPMCDGDGIKYLDNKEQNEDTNKKLRETCPQISRVFFASPIVAKDSLKSKHPIGEFS